MEYDFGKTLIKTIQIEKKTYSNYLRVSLFFDLETVLNKKKQFLIFSKKPRSKY